MPKAATENRADILEDAIKLLDTAFEEGADCILPDEIGEELGFQPNEVVSDPRYDMLRHELQQIRPTSKVFSETTASTLQTTNKKVKHEPPLTSIAKASHEIRERQEEMFFSWLMKTAEKAPAKIRSGPVYTLEDKIFEDGEPVRYPRDYFYQSYKLDGVALALYYEKGNLVRAGLRPRNGVDGEDVTDQVKYVKTIPQKLKLPVTCSVRGELICLRSDFEKVQKELEAAGEEPRANPRNHTAGGIRNFKDPEKVATMRLTFIAYAIEGHEEPLPYKTETERAKYCAKELGITHVQIRPFNFNQFAQMEANVKELEYEVDGIIIGVDSLQQQTELGRSGDSKIGTPKGKIAWKFAEERATPVIESIEWNTGRSGAIKPVAIFDAVPLAGTNVRRATLHNIGFMIRGKIGVGTKIIVLKAGKIIPKVVGVESGEVDHVLVPKKCPSCGADTVLDQSSGNNKAELFCVSKSCPAQNVNTLLHFLENIGVLGLGESKVTALVEGNKIKRAAHFFTITSEDIQDCDISERSALLIEANLHLIPSPEKTKDNAKLAKMIAKARASKKVIPLWKLFAAFGIESAGKSAGKALASHFNSFDAIRNASVDDLVQVGDIGEKTAKLVHEYLHDHVKEIDDLLKYVEVEMPKTGPLTGTSFVLSGGFPGGKKALEDAIEKDRGGKVSSSVGKSTTALVQGDEPGADKEAKAKKYGVPILPYDEFVKKYLV